MSGRTNTEVQTIFSPYAFRHQNMTGDQIKVSFSRELERFRIKHFLSKAFLSKLLGVTTTTYGNWISGNTLPSEEVQRNIDRVCHQVRFVRTNTATKLAPMKTAWVSELFNTVSSAVDEGFMDTAMARAVTFTSPDCIEALKKFVDNDEVHLVSDYKVRALFFYQLALYIKSKRENATLSMEYHQVLEQLEQETIYSPGLKYTVGSAIAGLKMQKAQELKESQGQSESLIKTATELELTYSRLHTLFPLCSFSLWNKAYVVSHFLKDEEKCKVIWLDILKHKHDFSFSKSVTERQKIDRALNCKSFNVLVTANNLDQLVPHLI